MTAPVFYFDDVAQVRGRSFECGSPNGNQGSQARCSDTMPGRSALVSTALWVVLAAAAIHVFAQWAQASPLYRAPDNLFAISLPDGFRPLRTAPTRGGDVEGGSAFRYDTGGKRIYLAIEIHGKPRSLQDFEREHEKAVKAMPDLRGFGKRAFHAQGIDGRLFSFSYAYEDDPSYRIHRRDLLFVTGGRCVLVYLECDGASLARMEELAGKIVEGLRNPRRGGGAGSVPGARSGPASGTNGGYAPGYGTKGGPSGAAPLRFCSSCGRPRVAGGRFCPYCGARYIDTVTAPSTGTARPAPKRPAGADARAGNVGTNGDTGPNGNTGSDGNAGSNGDTRTAGHTGSARPRPPVIIPGSPPLTERTVAIWRMLLEWTARTRLTARQQEQLVDAVKGEYLAGGSRRDEMVSLDRDFDPSRLYALGGAKADRTRRKLKRQFEKLAGRAASGGNLAAQVFGRVFEATRTRLGAGSPPLTRQVRDAVVELADFMYGLVRQGTTDTVGGGMDTLPRVRLGSRLARRWLSFTADRRRRFCDLVFMWSDLRLAWSFAAPEDRRAFSKGFRNFVRDFVKTARPGATGYRTLSGKLLDLMLDRPRYIVELAAEMDRLARARLSRGPAASAATAP